MADCGAVHRDYDGLANGDVQVGELPPWTHVEGPVAWYVFQGPYSALSDAWASFMQKALASGVSKPSGPPGDVYVCDPLDHLGEAEEKLTTILWVPLRE
ncbi:MAG: hypothetical protein ACE5I4_02335 [Thermoplasmata archaeon]